MNPVLKIIFRILTAPYAHLTHLECDGLTRVLHTVLSRMEAHAPAIDGVATHRHITHKCMTGRVAWLDGREMVPPLGWHCWIESDDDIVIDYRLQVWLGESAPHGVFERADMTAAGLEYRDAQEAAMPVLTPEVFAILMTPFPNPNPPSP